jgi:hypothetical protein
VGQQQLLLLVLATILVGFAILVGIDAYTRSQQQAAVDQMTTVALGIATDVQAYARKPDAYRRTNTTGSSALQIDFGELGSYPTNEATGDGDYVDDLATYSLNGHDTLPSGYDASACPGSSPVNTVEAYSTQYDVSVCIEIYGLSGSDLATGVVRGE